MCDVTQLNEVISILVLADKPLNSDEIFAKAKGFDDKKDLATAINQLCNLGNIERVKPEGGTGFTCYKLLHVVITEQGAIESEQADAPVADEVPAYAVLENLGKPQAVITKPSIQHRAKDEISMGQRCYEYVQNHPGCVAEEIRAATGASNPAGTLSWHLKQGAIRLDKTPGYLPKYYVAEAFPKEAEQTQPQPKTVSKPAPKPATNPPSVAVMPTTQFVAEKPVRFAMTSESTLVIQGLSYQDIELSKQQTAKLFEFAESMMHLVDALDAA